MNIENFRLIQSTTCSGILGRPAFTIDFGTCPNPNQPPGTNCIGAALSTNNISYIYSNFCNITSGRYTLTDNTINCNPTYWLGLPQDHTPNDMNGLMLLVDGNPNPGVVYQTDVYGLNTSFKYEFKAWVANIGQSNDAKPRFRFRIFDLSGNLISETNEIEVFRDQTNPWKEVAFVFELPRGIVDVKIVLENKNGNPIGNDFVVEDISFTPCYTDILASYTGTNPIVDIAEVCNSGSNNLYFRWPTAGIPFNNPVYQWERRSQSNPSWQPIVGATSNGVSVQETISDVYYYRVKCYDASNPSVVLTSNELIFYVRKVISTSNTQYALACDPSPIVLSPDYQLINYNPFANNGSLTFNWSPATNLSNPNIANPTLNVPPLPVNNNYITPSAVVSHNYSLIVSNNAYSGCSTSLNQTVKQSSPRPIAVPNIFTPNGDGVNDFFGPYNLEDYPGSKFEVRNRFGQAVFTSYGPTYQSYLWNGLFQGVPQPSNEAHVWYLTLKGCPTTTINIAGSGIIQSNFATNTILLVR